MWKFWKGKKRTARGREEDVAREIQAHLDLEAEERQEQNPSLSGREARLDAQRVFGNQTRLHEETRAVWRWAVLDQMAQDVTYAVRSARKRPGFTAVAMLSLAAGPVRLIRTFLFGVTEYDLTAWVGAAIVLSLIAAGAAFGPARRASSVDPVVALRYE